MTAAFCAMVASSSKFHGVAKPKIVFNELGDGFLGNPSLDALVSDCLRKNVKRTNVLTRYLGKPLIDYLKLGNATGGHGGFPPEVYDGLNQGLECRLQQVDGRLQAGHDVPEIPKNSGEVVNRNYVNLDLSHDSPSEILNLKLVSLSFCHQFHGVQLPPFLPHELAPGRHGQLFA